MKLSFLYGMTFGQWLRLLRHNRFRITPSALPHAALLTANSLFTSGVSWWEQLRYGPRIAATRLPGPPIFILGHWRGGTTHLHYLLTQDPNLSAPTTYQVSFPSTFLTLEPTHGRLLEHLLPRTRPQDNMAQGLSYPNEDEFAQCVLSGCSPYLAWAFPERTEHYLRYLTFRGVPREELQAFQQSLSWLIRKVTLRTGRQLVLKSPPHTARIRWLLEAFPDARFVHISRDPYHVYTSSEHLYRTWLEAFAFLQRPDPSTVPERILRLYRAMYDAYFEDLPLIPKGQHHALSYEALVEDPLGELERLYQALGLPGFGQAEPRLRAYLRGLEGYQKNRYAPMEEPLRERIAQAWAPCFEAFGYPR